MRNLLRMLFLCAAPLVTLARHLDFWLQTGSLNFRDLGINSEFPGLSQTMKNKLIVVAALYLLNFHFTADAQPVVTTQAASGVTATNATLNGAVVGPI